MRTSGIRRRRLLVLGAFVILSTILLMTAKRIRTIRGRARSNGLRTREYSRRAAAHLAAADDCEKFGGDDMLRVARDYRAMAEDEIRLAERHARLEHKYLEARFRPWISLAPDPP